MQNGMADVIKALYTVRFYGYDEFDDYLWHGDTRAREWQDKGLAALHSLRCVQ